MSSFATKRKAKIIRVQDEELSSGELPLTTNTNTSGSTEEPTASLLTPKPSRKPARQSGLRKAFSIDDEDDRKTDREAVEKDEQDDGPVVVRPEINRLGSTRMKRKSAKSRLSFGGDPDNADSEAVATPQKAGLGKKALENSAFKRSVSSRTLPTRTLDDDDSSDRPRYSKEYLDELQSSTPSTPRDISTLRIDDEEMSLDPSELDGALVVDSFGMPSSVQETQILSDAQIREKKERRARLAKEQGFLSVEDDVADSSGKEKEVSGRLVAEDEDLGEGFDEYVEDGGLSLGKQAEKARRKQERQRMADLISAAEGHSSDDSSDSDAERRIAYESAQSKAGLDGLEKPRADPSEEMLKIPSKITPLPQLPECVARFQATLKRMEDDLRAKNTQIQHLRAQREEIERRKAEIQSLLDETGKEYQEALTRGNINGQLVSGAGSGLDLIGERGLDSLGTTPKRPEADVMDVDSS
ncbi:hypothetical protein AAL_01794 [Moelleriella libera RCEF 2490]|uniref:Nineteen complex-related protein 2-domain-containing protein n=1 Tax=Moelleriella libera RCEF 2490 TaxID=1081109 RepID=A0A166UG47_9HYPO|nr:hypothetical protein AAL_01794 [Moelleriella libera RCEF 2490]